MAEMQTLLAIKYVRGSLQVLDQLQLPYKSVYLNVADSKAGHAVIRAMNVRGAPAIAITAMLSLCVEVLPISFNSKEQALVYIRERLNHLKTSRPTAVNLFEACDRLSAQCENSSDPKDMFIEAAEAMLASDIANNRRIGQYGAEFISSKRTKNDECNLLTHCNTGSLATAGWGTALGIIRSMNESGRLTHAYCTETRPYNQGARLTAYELVFEGIPSTLVCDSMVSHLLKTRNISAIVVGADRVAANGDTANKVGTYQLAIAAKYHGVDFIVAAPTTSIDLSTSSGEAIEIEERASDEVTKIRGLHGDKLVAVDIAAPGIGVWNPAFDITPACLITCIVTENGIAHHMDGVFDLTQVMSK